MAQYVSVDPVQMLTLAKRRYKYSLGKEVSIGTIAVPLRRRLPKLCTLLCREPLIKGSTGRVPADDVVWNCRLVVTSCLDLEVAQLFEYHLSRPATKDAGGKATLLSLRPIVEPMVNLLLRVRVVHKRGSTPSRQDD